VRSVGLVQVKSEPNAFRALLSPRYGSWRCRDCDDSGPKPIAPISGCTAPGYFITVLTVIDGISPAIPIRGERSSEVGTQSRVVSVRFIPLPRPGRPSLAGSFRLPDGVNRSIVQAAPTPMYRGPNERHRCPFRRIGRQARHASQFSEILKHGRAVLRLPRSPARGGWGATQHLLPARWEEAH
jgi:hypothetical protein